MVESIHVFFNCDERFAKPLMVALKSALDHLGRDYRLEAHIGDFGISAASISSIERILNNAGGSCRWVRSDWKKWMPESVVQAGISPAVCARMAMVSMLPEVDRVIYLDSDLVVLGDLSDLWQITADGAPVWAVRDQLMPWLASSPSFRNIEHGLPMKSRYLNAGVLVADLRVWRDLDLETRLLTFYQQHYKKLLYHDQDALNAVLVGLWKPLPLQWNRTPWLDSVVHWEDLEASPAELAHAFDNPKIVHYANQRKPWHSGLKNRLNDPFFETLETIEVGDWGRPARRTISLRWRDLQDEAWISIMGLVRRIRLRQVGILPNDRWLSKTLLGCARKPLIMMLGGVQLVLRKLRI